MNKPKNNKNDDIKMICYAMILVWWYFAVQSHFNIFVLSLFELRSIEFEKLQRIFKLFKILKVRKIWYIFLLKQIELKNGDKSSIISCSKRNIKKNMSWNL